MQQPRGKPSVRLFAFFMIVLLLVSGFLPYAPVKQVQAGGVGTGSSGSLNSAGSTRGLGGGLEYVGEAAFRVGLNYREELRNLGGTDAQKQKMYKAASSFLPFNYESLYFTPASKSISDFTIGEYNVAGRQMVKMNKAEAKKMVYKLSKVTSKPTLSLKNELKTLMKNDPDWINKLNKGQWKKRVTAREYQEALNMWSYVMYPPSGGTSGAMGASAYDIMPRLQAMVSSSASKWQPGKLSDAEMIDVAAGYLSVMMATYRLAPTDNTPGLAQLRKRWEDGIESFLKTTEDKKGAPPWSIVVDPVVVIKWTGKSERMYLSASDFLYFHNAISVTGVLNGKNNLGADAGNYYDMARKALALDLIAAPKFDRISSKYNSSNAFSHGASAIDYPGKVLMNIRGTSKWVTASSQAAFIDTMTYLKSSDGKRVLRGYVTMSFEGLIDDMCEEECGGETLKETTAKIRIKNVTTEKNVLLPAEQETIGQRNLVTLRMDTLTSTTYSTWKKIMSNDFKDNSEKKIDNSTVKVKIELTRVVTPNNASAPSYSSPSGNITNLTMTRAQWLDFVEGFSTIQIFDDVANDPIAENSTVKYSYIPKLTVTYKNEKGNATADSTANEDYASYKRPKMPPKYMGYTSTHFENSEIKNETPNNESFNAMAGVPSNKRLYYAIGGSEFIVDVELERIEKEKSVWRKYHSYFTSVDSEYKAGDTAPNQMLGGHSVDLHNGGTYTKTWSGSIPNNGVAVTTNGSGSVSATSVAVPDRSAYDAHKAEAQAYVQEVNSTVLSHTAASDKVTRKHKGWGASITTDSSPNPQNVTTSNSCYHSETRGSGENSYTVQVADPCTTTASPSGATSYTITVTFNVPKRIVDGPESTYVLPQVNDTWKTRGEFDYVKIIRANVYKLEAGKLKETGSVLIDQKDEMNAKIVQGNHTLWFNIAQRNANGNDTNAQSSTNGRVRYTLEEGKHDNVVWNEGVRTNKSAGMGANGVQVAPDSGGTIARQGGGHTNTWATKGILYNRTDYANKVDAHKNVVATKTAISSSVDAFDMATPEWKKFDERRNSKNTTTVVSDFIILQTSSGDQSVMYFDKDAPEVTAQEDFEYVQATREEMWEDNPLSSANWTKNSINNGSYNGEFREAGASCSTNKKFWGMDRNSLEFKNNCTGSKVSIETRLDAFGAGAGAATKRSARPSAQLQIYETVRIEPTTVNDDYAFGTSQVFYNELLDYKSNNPYKDYEGAVELRDNAYEPKNQVDFTNKKGLVYDAYYSKDHEKINDIVIHTPVSSENAMIIASPSWLDQRSTFPPGGAAAMIDQDNADRVAFENSQAVTFEFDDAVKKWTTIKTTTKTDVKNDANALVEGFSKTTSKTTVTTTKDYYESGDPNAFQGYTWEQLFGANWRNYVVTTTETSSTVDKSKNVKTEDNGVRYISRKWLFEKDVEGFTSGTANVSYKKENMVVKYDQGLTEAQLTDGTVTPNEVYFTSPSNLNITNVDPEKDVIEFRMKVVKGGKRVKIQFTTDTSTSFTTANTITGSLESVNGVDANGYGTYRVALKHANWKGTIKQLRIYLATGDYVTELDIDHIKIFAGSRNTGSMSGTGTGSQLGLFNYTGTVQTFTVPTTGTYKLETWGASGGNYTSYNGGRGGYAVGEIELTAGETIYIYVGGKGAVGSLTGGFNGGGGMYNQGSASGGGATDIRKGASALSNRVIVAAGGGGAGSGNGGAGGGLTSDITTDGTYGNVGGASQTSGGSVNNTSSHQATSGSLGQGGTGFGNSGGGGGGGYYGGSGAVHVGGTGGSSFIASLTNAQTLGGNAQMPLPNGTTGYNSYDSNGTAKISIVASSGGGGGEVKDFPYTGSVQTFTAPDSAEYLIETWGAEGGTSGYGGKGGYSKGYVTLNKGETVYVYTGGKSGWNGGGVGSWAQDTGGGASDVRKGGQALTHRIIVAGGGGGWGGASHALGGAGGGLAGLQATSGLGGVGYGGTQTSGGSPGSYGTAGTLGQGGNNTTGSNSGGGGGGGGYYGGGAGGCDCGGYNDRDDAGGGGGSGYIGGVTGGQTIAGNTAIPKVAGNGVETQTGNSGDGHVRITSMKPDPSNSYQEVITTTKNITKEITEETERTTVLTDLVKRDIALFPDYMDDKSYNPIKLALGVKETPKSPLDEPVVTAQGGKINMGTFIVLDREFQIYYPNVGNFAQQPTLRASKEITTTRGLGYVNAMDVTQYTEAKYVKFEIDVIFQGVTYQKNTWIPLPVAQEYFQFYNVLSNNEASASEIQFHSVAINAPDLVNDNWDAVTNKTRFTDYSAKHGSFKKTYTDVIGRIGNLAITDTDDFRFSNLFKTPVDEDKWIVEGVIKEVNQYKQNKYYGDLIDIRGEDKSATFGLNTYGVQKWLEKPRLSLPINPMDNDATALKSEFLKVGYDIYGNVQTIGDYAEGAVRILPYYYKLEFNNGGDSVKLIPLDVYQQDGGAYKAVNRYGAADNGFVPSDITSYPMVIDWEKESGRFNFTIDEANVTAKASEAFGRNVTGMVENEEMGLTEGVVETLPLMTPNGNYISVGNAQRLVLDSTLRTFIGNTETYGLDKNPGDVLEAPLYNYHGQKWYYKIGLPANSVFVKAGTNMVDGDPQSAIEEIKKGGGLILMTADIVAIGDVFSLRYNQYGNTNFDVMKDGKTINISLEKLVQQGLQPYLALYDLDTSAVIDVETKGSH